MNAQELLERMAEYGVEEYPLKNMRGREIEAEHPNTTQTQDLKQQINKLSEITLAFSDAAEFKNDSIDYTPSPKGPELS